MRHTDAGYGSKDHYLRDDGPRAQQIWARYIRPWATTVVVAILITQVILWKTGSVPGWVITALTFLLIATEVLWFIGSRARRNLSVYVPRGLSRLVSRAETAWGALPADLRENTRPILSAVYQAAVLPKDPEPELLARVELLEGFAAEAKQREQITAVQALGSADLEAGEHALRALQELRGFEGDPR